MATRGPDVTVAEGAGLGGPKLEDDCWLWFVLLWWLEDWLPPDRRTPPWSLVYFALGLGLGGSFASSLRRLPVVSPGQMIPKVTLTRFGRRELPFASP